MAHKPLKEFQPKFNTSYCWLTNVLAYEGHEFKGHSHVNALRWRHTDQRFTVDFHRVSSEISYFLRETVTNTGSVSWSNVQSFLCFVVMFLQYRPKYSPVS